MNWIDLLLMVLVLFALWAGWQRGFISGALALASWAGSFVAGYFLYPGAAPLLLNFFPSLGGWAPAVAFISIVILSRILLNALSRAFLQQTSEETHRYPVNKILGLVPGFANGTMQAIVASTLLLTIPFRNKISDAARESRIANALAPPAFFIARQLSPIFSTPLRSIKPPAKHDEKEFISLPYKVKTPTVRQDLEAQMLVLVNKERAKEGLNALAPDPEMQRVARAHSKDMFARSYFAHVDPDGRDPFDRMHVGGVTFLSAGENLALAQTLAQAHDGLMHSPGHRANILQPQFGRLGIGILDGGIYGLMITQNFRN